MTQPALHQPPRRAWPSIHFQRAYQSIRLLGRGAFGRVILARRRADSRIVAVKFMGRAPELDSLGSFVEEARILMRFDHPNIRGIVSLDLADNPPYLVLEYVDGASLRERLVRSRLSPQECLDVVIGIARGLATCHEAGVVHRDLKPANVLLTKEGQPKIGDFGVARDLFHKTNESTASDRIMGTPYYMAPEVMSGFPPDPSSDLHSLGVILYQCLTGQLPFQAEDLFELRRLKEEESPLAPRDVDPSIPASLSALCMRMLAADPLARPLHVREVLSELEPIREHLWEPSRRQSRTRQMASLRLVVGDLGLTNG